jgi:hypothetical protein
MWLIIAGTIDFYQKSIVPFVARGIPRRKGPSERDRLLEEPDTPALIPSNPAAPLRPAEPLFANWQARGANAPSRFPWQPGDLVVQ